MPRGGEQRGGKSSTELARTINHRTRTVRGHMKGGGGHDKIIGVTRPSRKATLSGVKAISDNDSRVVGAAAAAGGTVRAAPSSKRDGDLLHGASYYSGPLPEVVPQPQDAADFWRGRRRT